MYSLQKDIYFVNRISYRIALKKKKDRLWNARCPICGDSATVKGKKRFFIYENKGKLKWKCHNCGLGGSFYSLIRDHFPDMLEEYKFWGFTKNKSFAEETLSKLDSVPDAKKEKPQFVSMSSIKSLTIDYNLLKDTHPAKKYVVNRQIPFKRVRYCPNFYEFSKKLHQEDTFKQYAIPCIIIPFERMNSKIEILQARFYDPKVKPKYITVKFNGDALKIYNQDYVDSSKTVWVVEGPVDSMFVNNAIAMAGADISVDYPNQVWVYDNEPHNNEINDRMKRRINAGEKIVIWRKTDNYKDINEGLIKGHFTVDNITKMLHDRTFVGLKAKLAFAKYKG